MNNDSIVERIIRFVVNCELHYTLSDLEDNVFDIVLEEDCICRKFVRYR